MDFSSGIDLVKLAELLKPPQEEVTIQENDDLPKAGEQAFNNISKS